MSNLLAARVTLTLDGPFTFVVTRDAVVAAGWGEDAAVTLAHMTGYQPCDRAQARVAQQAIEAVEAYYSGDYSLIMDVPVKQPGSEFRQRVWRELRGVAAGSTITYGGLAALAGRPAAARAVGSTMACNAVPLFVPCHRVVRSDGSIGQFAFGPALKASLLEREHATLSEAPTK